MPLLFAYGMNRFSHDMAQIFLTVNFLNIRTSKKIVVITLTFELCGSTIK